MSRGLPRCGSCQEYIQWAVMVDGRRIPLNLAASATQGTVWILEDGRARFLSKEEQQRARDSGHGDEMRVLHHQTCVSVERHRGVSRAQTELDLFGGAA